MGGPDKTPGRQKQKPCSQHNSHPPRGPSAGPMWFPHKTPTAQGTGVQSALDPSAAPAEVVGVEHGGPHVLVYEQFLYGPNVLSFLQQMGCEGMPERVARGELRRAGRRTAAFAAKWVREALLSASPMSVGWRTLRRKMRRRTHSPWAVAPLGAASAVAQTGRRADDGRAASAWQDP